MQKKKKVFTRYSVLFIIMIFIFTAIFSRLVYLQVLNGEEYKQMADDKSIREIPDPAPRGKILDKNGVVLASNTQSYVLVYNSTKESELSFYPTMDKVFQLLDKNKENIKDDLELKLNPVHFEFKTSNADAKKVLEARFKRDRGMNEKIEKDLFKEKIEKKQNLTDEERERVDQQLLKISPQDTFNYMVDFYDITPKANFSNLLELYTLDKNRALNYLQEYFKIKPEDIQKDMQEYNKDPKGVTKKLIQKYNIDSYSFTPEQQRRYMIIKDALKMESFSGYKPVTIAMNISQDTAFTILQVLNDIPGIDVVNQPIRSYPFGQLGSAFLGYISKISNNQDKYDERGYDVSTDYVGTEGLEYVLESRLKGSKGGRIVKLNKQGRITEELGRTDPYPGQNVQLTIDKNVQEAAEKSLDVVMSRLQLGVKNFDNSNTTNATRGAAVAIDVKTGKILALASRPGYDPNLFAISSRLTDELYNQYFNPDIEKLGKEFIKSQGLSEQYKRPDGTVVPRLDELFPVDKNASNLLGKTVRQDSHDIFPKPFYNYATLSLVPPGSTFKPVTAIAGLQEGVITPTSTIHDGVQFTKYNFNGKDWNTYSLGDITVVHALEASNNYFFFEVGDRLYMQDMKNNKTPDTLAKYAWKLGLGVDPNGKEKPSTGIELYENFGQTYNSQSYKNRISSAYIDKIANELLNLRKLSDNTYEGISIETADSDSKETKSLKQKLQDLITNQIRYNNITDFSNQITETLNKIIQSIPECKKKNFTNGEIKSAVQTINVAVIEALAEADRPGNVLNASIGQGINQFTPLQLATYMATIANGGTRYKAHIIDKYLDQNNNVIEETKPEVLNKVEISPENLNAIREGLYRVNYGEDGTAGNTFENFPITVAGKTGSGTVAQDIEKEWGRTSYAVYAGFAPYDNPQIAVCAIVFDGGHGGMITPIVKAMYEAYFMDELKKQGYVTKPIYPDNTTDSTTAERVYNKVQIDPNFMSNIFGGKSYLDSLSSNAVNKTKNNSSN